MNTPTQGFTGPTLAPDLLRKQYELAQNQRYAQMLMEDGSQMPQGQMVSGHYVAPSITQYLAQALKSGLGGSIARGVPDQMADMSRAQQDYQMQQFNSLFGSGAGGASGSSPFAAQDPQREALIAQLVGMDKYALEKLKQSAPTNEQKNLGFMPQDQRNQVIAAPFINEMGSGGVQNFLDPASGRVVAQPVPGYTDIQAQQAGATAGAQEQAKAGLDLVEVPMPDGSKQMMTRADASKVISGGGFQQETTQQPAGQAGYTPPESVREARAAIGQTEADIGQMTNLIDMTLNHPGLSSAVGWQGMIPDSVIPAGTEAANFMSVLDQLKGKAFLEAFESLKGGGAITEREGEAATKAMARLSRAQSEDAFKQSLNEFKGVLNSALERARSKAGVQSQDSQQPQQQGTEPAQPANRAEYDALPSGATFRAPDGTIRRKP